MLEQETIDQARVLVIDDERGTRESLRFALRDEYSIATAESVEEGLSFLDRERYDTVVLDLRLPGLNGIEGLRRIRQIDDEVAVVILTAYGSLETAQEAIRLGANDYQLKPFDVREMHEVVDKYVHVTRATRRCRDLSAEVRKINENLADEVQQQARYAYVGQLAAGLMHDFGGPLSGLYVYLELVREGLHELDSGGRLDAVMSHLDRAENALQIMRDMISSFRRLCHGEQGVWEPVDLQELINDVLVVLKPSSLDRGYRVCTSLLPEATMVYGDRLQLFRAFCNVINNALEAVEPAVGLVEVNFETTAEEIIVTVRDDGPGIEAGNLERVFNRYFTTKEDGTGLGLFITQSVVQAHEGRVDIQSVVGDGTCVTIALPRAPALRQGEQS